MTDLIPLLQKQNPAFSNRLLSIKNEISQLALENIKDAVATGHYTGPEVYAMQRFEELRLSNDIDLYSVLVRGEIIKDIEDHNLWSTLPGDYHSIEEALEERGKVSKTKYSTTINLYRLVLPYVVEHLNMSVQEFWENIGQSNAADALPYLRAIITDTPSKRDSVNEVVDKIMKEVGDIENPEERKKAAVELVLDRAELTNSELRKSASPTPIINMLVLRRNGNRYIMADLSEDQLALVQSKLRDQVDFTYLSMEDPNRIPLFRKMIEPETEAV